ncbi:MAG: hypothetical protein M1834_007003 [Cirrosporium novae-zelandiae]|nr:MAG: hypothetical protein M1834_007003 [Cirrosporium novae-zelandiae]
MIFIFYLLSISLALAESDLYTTYLSRPELKVPLYSVSVNDEVLTSPGYIFVSPTDVDQAGPYIYDTQGNLIWSGYASVGSNVADFQPCQYKGSEAICYYHGVQANAHAIGQAVIFDSHYVAVRSGQSIFGSPVDSHEFNVIEDGTRALLSGYTAVRRDLSNYDITDGQGWLSSGIAQEIDVTTGESIFKWSSADFVDPEECIAPINKTLGRPMVTGDGLTPGNAYDYFYINSIDKTSDGDYLVSGRHCCTIYKISGVDGSIIWKLGGYDAVDSDFVRDGFNFSFQHDIRVVSTNSTTTVISLFDNASDLYNETSTESSGKVIALDNTTMTATLVHSYTAPNMTDNSTNIFTAYMGNLQLLSNGNAFLAWGGHAVVTEHTTDGDLIYYAAVGNDSTTHYRAFKGNWTGYPLDTPAVYTYSHNTSAPTFIAASWNGATETASWKFYGGSNRTGEFTALGTVERTGFETNYTAAGYEPYVVVEALTANGTSLGKSVITQTFVPGDSLTDYCDDVMCPETDHYS